jgi:DNA-binding response OmpR family regulator
MLSMADDRPRVTRALITADAWEWHQEAAWREWHADTPRRRAPVSFRDAFGEEPIYLDLVEFRILLFLASRPYHAFTRREIAEAVGTEQHPVEEGDVDRHVKTLRDQLGVLHDYVQTTPYIGYRFKA